jgi:2,4-dienoyl-CoA reductase-like NADH-dependent reductase (Old Yellow Enzyme family)
MWKPVERIKHSVEAGIWPDAEQARHARWFSPIALGPVQVNDRTWVPAMVPWRASDEGFVTPDVINWYARLARGKPGVLVVEATGIRDVPSGPLLRIGDDRFTAGLSELVEAVRVASDGKTRLFIQLIDFLSIRRRPEKDVFLQRHLRVTDQHRQHLKLEGVGADELTVRTALEALGDDALEQALDPREWESLTHGYRERVTDTHLPHVRDLPLQLPALFANAAKRAESAGFDGIELHYAHAYTMASFLSAKNTRDDGYGGSAEQRARLPLEVFDAVRNALGKEIAIGCRMLTDECIEGGSTVADASWFAEQFARAGMDFISFSRGGKFEDAKTPKPGWTAYPYTGRSGFECMPTAISDAFGPFGRNVADVDTIRTRLRAAGLETPIVLCGGVHDFAQAEMLLESDQADLVGAARQTLADPDWFEKIRQGAGQQVRLCKYTNYCEGLDQKHKQVTCQLWDREELDHPDVHRTADGKRRLVPPPWRGSGEN